MWYIFTQEKADKSCWYRNINIEADTKEEAFKIYKDFLKRNLHSLDIDSLSVMEDEYGHNDTVDISNVSFEDEEE